MCFNLKFQSLFCGPEQINLFMNSKVLLVKAAEPCLDPHDEPNLNNENKINN